MDDNNYYTLSKILFAKLESIFRAKDGQPYEDNWRNEYQSRSGMLLIYEKEDLACFRFFVDGLKDPFLISHLSSGTGKLEIDGKTITLKSRNSLYRFRDVTDETDEKIKTGMYLNVFGADLVI